MVIENLNTIRNHIGDFYDYDKNHAITEKNS